MASNLRDKDGNQYTSIIAGNQEWIVENLKTTHYADGTEIPYIYNPDEWANGINATKGEYGALYNWYAASANIAPAGWHVPTSADFQTLITELGGLTLAGNALKEVGLTHWSDDVGATNSSGFTAIGAGIRTSDGYAFLNYLNWLWSSEEYYGTDSYYLWLQADTASVQLTWTQKFAGMSIRLVKDDSDNIDQIIDYDGNVYDCVKIGNQVWTTSNFKCTHLNDGTLIDSVSLDQDWNNYITPAMCIYGNNPGVMDGFYCWYNNDISNGAIYGNLYNQYAVTKANGLAYIEQNGVQQVGWRVPSQADFESLITFLGGSTIAGGKLKEIGLTHWINPNLASDTIGFKGLPSGIREGFNGVFDALGYYLNLWTSEIGISDTEYYYISNSSENISTDLADIRNGFSVRLVRDYTPPVDPEDPPPIPVPPYQVGNFPTYRFYLSNGSATLQEVFPLNFNQTSLVDELEQDKIFYRRKINGALIFGTNSIVKDALGASHNRCEDWDLIWNIENTDPCAKNYLTVEKTVGGVTSDYWTGYFSTTDGKFDIDKKTFEVTPLPFDDYALILEQGDLEFDILTNTDEVITIANDGVINETYTHNHWLIDVITFLASEVSPGSNLISEFFTSATNYVTGLASKTTLLTIAQKSDIKYPGATNPASYPQGVLTWNKLMDILWGMFQVTWMYDNLTDTIYVEHISKFPVNPLGEMDVRDQLACVATNKYSYMKEEMPKYEKFSFMEANNVNFSGVPIRYESACVNQDNSTNSTETSVNVTTDLEYIYNTVNDGNPEAISNDGWVILCNTGSGPYSVDIESGVWNSDIKLNMHLAWCNLHKNYFLHNRILIEGYINNSLTQFASSIKTKQQEFSMVYCGIFDPDNAIRTELGELYFEGEKGKVKQAQISPSGEIKLTVIYSAKGYTLTPPVEPNPWVKLVQTGCSHFEAILSEAAPVGGLTIEFRWVVMNRTNHVSICYNSDPWDVWTIAEGETVSSFDVPLTCEIPDPGCVYYYRVTPTTGWDLSIDYDENCKC